jgi:ubiquinol-cytochrome c reductase cytochrome c subunit
VTDDIDAEDGDFGFEPAVSVTGADDHADELRAGRRSVRRSNRRPRNRGAETAAASSSRRVSIPRRIGAAAILVGALGTMGAAYAALATSSGAANSASTSADINAGQSLYSVSCITCHGANLEGVKGQGPSLIGVGSSSVYFQVSTGRMPAVGQGAYEPRKEAKYDELQVDQLGDYIESVGGGPSLPDGTLRSANSEIGRGGELFRLNCASCHGTTFKGAPLSAGKIAPSLNKATDKQIYAAMQSGPESMPVFSDNEITPADKRQIISYIQTLKASKDPGGNGIDRIGPVSEAIVIWVGGVGALMVFILWIGARAR